MSVAAAAWSEPAEVVTESERAQLDGIERLVEMGMKAHALSKPLELVGDVAGRRLVFERLSEVTEKAVRFFDRPLLQAATFHILAARKGAGKGTYLAWLAAKITRGERGPRKNVIWIASEDSSAQDIKPRVSVAGGDCGNVYVVKAGWMQLPRDIDEIAGIAQGIGDVALIIIDPVGNHIDGANSDSETATREAIGPLNGLADGLDALVIGTRHLTEKDIREGLLAAILGSSAWVQVPRVVIGIVEDDEEVNVRHIRVGRGNRVPPGEDSLMFKIEGVPREGHDVEITRVAWLGSSDKDIDALLRGENADSKSKSALARDAIIDELEAAPEMQMESDTLDARIVERCGVSAKTVKNLRSELKDAGLVKVFPDKDEHGKVLQWNVARTRAPYLGPDADVA
jgi:AAA domain-containing protein